MVISDEEGEQTSRKVKRHALRKHRLERAKFWGGLPFRRIGRRERPPRPQQVVVQPRIEINQPGTKEKSRGFSTFIKILLLVVIVFFILNLMKVGEFDVYWSEATAAIGTPFTNIKSSLYEIGSTAYSSPREALEDIGKFRNPYVSEQKIIKNKGVIIKSFEASNKYYENEKVTVRGVIEVKNVESRLDLVISCDTKDKKTDSITALQEVSIRINSAFSNTKSDKTGEIKVTVPPSQNQPRILQVTCVYDGFKIDDPKKERTGKNINLNVVYRVTTSSVLPFYLVDKQEIAQEVNLFKQYGLHDDLVKQGILRGEGTIKAEPRGAGVPIFVSVNLLDGIPQPVTVGEITTIKARLFNTLYDKQVWRGELKKLNLLQITLPDNFKFNEQGCKNFVGGNLKSTLISNVNEAYCDSSTTNKDKCIGSKDDIKFDCEIQVPSTLQNDKGLEKHLIIANADYLYEVSKKGSVEILKKKDNILTGNVVKFTENLLKDF
tara:strand:- start:4190 stop:5665 length:1476 start_codon:yes stop_codon:yes gene_type:complete